VYIILLLAGAWAVTRKKNCVCRHTSDVSRHPWENERAMMAVTPYHAYAWSYGA